MSETTVLDASALLALLQDEPGSQQVEAVLSNSVMSSVNVSEVAGKLIDIKMPEKDVTVLIDRLVPKVITFDLQQAYIAAQIKPLTQRYGLSLGDRSCLALAIAKNWPVLTADVAWKKLSLDISVQLLR